MNRTSKVFFKRGGLEDFLNVPQKILDGLKRTNFPSAARKGDFVGLKIHFGEKGNHSYINPDLLASLIKFLKKRGTYPFFFETNTLYRGKRVNAVDHLNLAVSHGFSRAGIPIIIGDGVKGDDYREVKIEQKHFSVCFLADVLKDIDYLIVLSHFTGHMLTGFGAAVKNLGMGCASRRGKLAQHCQIKPKINEHKCIGCGVCAVNCLARAIAKKGEKYFIREELCNGCAQCVSVCPRDAVKIIWSQEYNLIGEKMVEYAYAAAKERKCIYVNFCLYITKECDCMNSEKTSAVADLGVLFSEDPVSIDKASIDLLKEREKQDFLKEAHPQIDYLHHLQYAQDIGLGSLDYKLIEI